PPLAGGPNLPSRRRWRIRGGVASGQRHLPLPKTIFATLRWFWPSRKGRAKRCLEERSGPPVSRSGGLADASARRIDYMTRMDTEQIASDFAFLDEWEDRYRYIVELGRQLPPLPEAERTAENKVRGCASQVWLATHVADGHLHFEGDSDALIVRGLVALAIALFDDKTPAEVIA